MPEDRVEQLLRVEAGLSRSFIGYVAGLAASVGWMLFLAPSATPGGRLAFTLPFVLILVFEWVCFIWYAVAAGAAAKALGDAGWKYVAWILVSPFVAMVPIPIVSTVIAVSPLSIKFLLGGQLQTAIRQESLAPLHT
jgi:hypothetical protein